MARRRSSGRVRIIGGRWRGRRIVFPDAAGLRPTPDRVRETLFNWLTPYLAGARVLDLFAGSGILGLEALSRDAAALVAVERHRGTAERLRATAAGLDAGEACEVVVSDVDAFLSRPVLEPFDVVFTDPPHADTDYAALCERVEHSGLLVPGALVYVEHSRYRVDTFRAPSSWECHRSAKAGDVAYQLWRRIAPASN